jgi:hypothetical protein
MRLSRDLLVRGITYKLQERAYGGLSTAAARKLERASADPLGRGAAKPTQPIALKPGTRLSPVSLGRNVFTRPRPKPAILLSEIPKVIQRGLSEQNTYCLFQTIFHDFGAQFSLIVSRKTLQTIDD